MPRSRSLSLAWLVQLRASLLLLLVAGGTVHAAVIPDYDPGTPVFVPDPAIAAQVPAPAALPPVAKAGEYPRLLFTPAELASFHAALGTSDRGRVALTQLRAKVQAALRTPVVFPSVEDTVANRADRAHAALAQRAQALAFAYALEGDRRYGLAAREILLGYAERYPGYPRHKGRNHSDSSKVFFQRLSEAMWLMPLLETCDYLYAGDVLSADDKRLVETKLIRPAILEIRRASSADEIASRDQKNPAWRTTTPPAAIRGTYPNWVNFYSAATLMAGALLDDRQLIDLAAADFRTAITRGIGVDGMWGEGAIGYQFFAMEAMATGFEAAARQGIDLWDVSDGRFKQLFDSPLRYAYPDGTLPGINDSGRARLGTWQTIVYDYGYLRYRDPAYARVINATPRQLFNSEGIYTPTQIYAPLSVASAADPGSALFAGVGYALLRDATKYALLDYGPHGGVHGHYDKLNLILFGSSAGHAGDELGGEPVFHPYTNPLHQEWTIQSVAHNTMTVDGRSQAATEGKLLVFADSPKLKIMRAESLGAYPGAWLDRTVVVTPELVIDVYLGTSAEPHTWDRTLRYAGKLSTPSGPTGPTAPLGSQDGYEHLQAYAPQAASTGWQGTWATKAGAFDATLAGAPGQQVILARGPDQDDIALARQQGTRGNFAAVYRLRDWPDAVRTVRWLSLGENGSPAVLEVTQESGAITLVAIARGPGPWSAAGWTSDARVLCVRRDGVGASGLLAGGTFATSGTFELRQSVPGIYPLQEKLQIPTSKLH